MIYQRQKTQSSQNASSDPKVFAILLLLFKKEIENQNIWSLNWNQFHINIYWSKNYRRDRFREVLHEFFCVNGNFEITAYVEVERIFENTMHIISFQHTIWNCNATNDKICSVESCRRQNLAKWSEWKFSTIFDICCIYSKLNH